MHTRSLKPKDMLAIDTC